MSYSGFPRPVQTRTTLFELIRRRSNLSILLRGLRIPHIDIVRMEVSTRVPVSLSEQEWDYLEEDSR